MAYSFSKSTAAIPALVSELEIAATRRRGHLTLAPNPNQRHDYVVTLSGALHLPALAPTLSATLHYVPDRNVLAAGAFAAYLDALTAFSWATLEELAATTLDDLNNELIPRWVHIRLIADGDASGHRHCVDLEDRQPNWENLAMLARLDHR